jgi:hypothetical protein
LKPFWNEIEQLLEHDALLKPYVIFEHLRELHPDTFPPKCKRTLERRVLQWKLDHGTGKTVTFDQIHHLADVSAFDFTSMNELGVTIAGERFDHLVFHNVLTYSNWEYAEVCLSESFEAVASGLQNAFLAIGGVTRRVRCDSLTAAVNNLSVDREFQSNYRDLLKHFGVKGHRINVRAAHENGDCESSHGHFKDYIDQQLRLRGNRDFESLDEWKAFLQKNIERRNQPRQADFRREQAVLQPLPPEAFPTYTQLELTVRSNAMLTIKQNTYCVPSRLIGLLVHVRVYADSIEVWHAGKKLFNMPRLIGKSQVYFDFRHVIDSLVRKPNAFANYRYREHLYPSLTFRHAFDWLEIKLGEEPAIRVYLKALYAAKQESLEAVENLLRQWMATETPMTRKELEAQLKNLNATGAGPELNDVSIEQPALEVYDDLLEHKEVPYEPERNIDASVTETSQPIGDERALETASFASHARVCSESCPTGFQRELDSSGVSESTDDPRMRSSNRESTCSSPSEHSRSTLQDMESNQLESNSGIRSTMHGTTAHRRVPQTNQQRSDLWLPWFREDDVASRVGLRTHTSGAFGLLYTMLYAGSTPAVGEKGTTTSSTSLEDRSCLGLDYRRSGLCSTEPRGDGSPIHLDRRSLRTFEYPAEQQSTIFKMGEHFQGPDDDGCRHRSFSPPQCDLGAERPQLSTRGVEAKSLQPATRPKPIITNLEFENSHCGNLIVAKVEFR